MVLLYELISDFYIKSNEISQIKIYLFDIVFQTMFL